ncbi:hypothetical protein ACIQOW_09390 [Kitasatospora sp. NPDC091335]|uniref:hypothetical protein n=1 Tax=Kitasatospora sp. NPDC091335 TaxID=3364085 RepID=UPI00382ADD4A
MGDPRRDGARARRSGTGARPEDGAASAQSGAALQRTVGNAATARMIAGHRDGTGADGRALPGIQRAPDGRAAAPTRPRQLTPDNVLRVCEAATYDGRDVTSRGRAAALRDIVWKDHWAPISAVCRRHKYTIAVRETGEFSIRRIEEGAKPKPHTILENSIKPSSVEKKYARAEGGSELVLNWLEEHDLSGFVGHWDAQGLIGVRIDNPPPAVQVLGIVRTGAGGEPYVPIDMNARDGGPELAQLKAVPRWKQYLYTGDYDLHEVYSATVTRPRTG